MMWCLRLPTHLPVNDVDATEGNFQGGKAYWLLIPTQVFYLLIPSKNIWANAKGKNEVNDERFPIAGDGESSDGDIF